MFLIIFLNAIFASTFTLGKAALNMGGNPIFFIGLRMFFAGMGLLGYWYIFKLKQNVSIRKNIKDILLFSLIGIAISYLTEFWLLQKISSVKASLIFNLSPFVAALLSYLMLNEKINKRKWIAICIGFIGFLPLIFFSKDSKSLLSISIFDSLMLASVFAYTYGWVKMKQLIQKGFSPIWINGFAMLITGIISLSISLATSSYGNIFSWPKFLSLTFAIIIVGNFISYVGLGYLLKKYSATFITLGGLVRPLFAGAYGFIFLSERITITFWLSMVIVSIGLYLFHKEEIKNF